MTGERPAWWQRFATRQQLGLLAVVFMACLAAFTHRETVTWRGRDVPAELRVVPDARLGYNSADILAYFEAIGSRGRGLYVATQLTVDLIFPVVYAILLASLLGKLYSPRSAWVWVPVAAAAADVSENILLVSLACTYAGETDATPMIVWVTSAAAIFTMLKWALLAATAAGVLLGGVRWALHAVQSEQTERA